jgi:sugar/nucleoside kinase (ribokinase family)
VDPELFTGAPWVAVSGYLLHEPGAAGLAEALAAGTARRVLLGCAVPDALVDGWRSAAVALRPHLTALNRDEAQRQAPGRSDGVAVTDAGGATVSIAGVSVESRTAAVAPARDTTGAGDAFAAGLVAGLRDAAWPPERERMQDAVEAAVALAGRVARVTGAQTRVAGEPAPTLPG